MPIVAFIINRTGHTLTPKNYRLNNYDIKQKPLVIPARSGGIRAFELIGPDLEALNFLNVDCIGYTVGPVENGQIIYFRFQMKPAEQVDGPLILASQSVTSDGKHSSPTSYATSYPNYRVVFVLG